MTMTRSEYNQFERAISTASSKDEIKQIVTEVSGFEDCKRRTDLLRAALTFSSMIPK
jgi:hypothetical protein